MLETQELMHYIGENVKQYRLQKGMRQEELCEGLFSVSQLSKIENGKAQVKPEHLKILAERLGVAVEQLKTTDAIRDELCDQLEQAKEATRRHHYSRAFELIRAVSARAQASGYHDLHAEAVRSECYLLNMTEHNYAAALELLRRTLQTNGEFDPITRADLLIEYGRAYSFTGDLVEGFRRCLEADLLLQSTEPVRTDLYAQVLFRICKSMFYMQNWRTGYRYADLAAKGAEQHGLPSIRIRATSMKAIFADKLGRSEEAKGLLEDLLRDTGDVPSDQLIHERGMLENNLGCWYLERGDLERAEVYLQRSLATCERLQDEYLLCKPLMSLAEWAQRAGDTTRSLQLATRVLDLVQSGEWIGLHYLSAGRMLALNAKTYGMLGDEARMLANYEQALNLLDRNRAILPANAICIRLADLYYERDHLRALDLYKQSIGYNRLIQELCMKQ